MAKSRREWRLWQVGGVVGLATIATLVSSLDDGTWAYVRSGALWLAQGRYKSDPFVVFSVPLHPHAWAPRYYHGTPVIGLGPMVTLIVRDAAGKKVDEWGIGVGDDGATYFPDGLKAGTYQLIGRTKTSLSWKRTLHFDGRFPQRIFPRWRFGDLDGDDFVSRREVEFVRSQIGKAVSENQFFHPEKRGLTSLFAILREKRPTPLKRPTPFRLDDADLNGDGLVTNQDVRLAEESLERRGEARLYWHGPSDTNLMLR